MASAKSNFEMLMKMDEDGEIKKIVSMKNELKVLIRAVALEGMIVRDNSNLCGAGTELVHVYNALCGAEMFIKQYLGVELV